jgi:selenoprotein W-related protein
LATNLLETYKQKITQLSLEPSDGGCFEVIAGDKLIYSKLETGSFPEESTVVGDVGALLD